MDVIQCSTCVVNNPDVETRLPNWADTDAMGNTHLVPVYDCYYRPMIINKQKKMAMIRHHDESVKEKWMKFLHAIQHLNCFARIYIILK